MTQVGLMHPVGAIQAPVGIYEQRPGEPGFGDVLASLLTPLEGHHQDLDVELIQPDTRSLQLQQMSTTGQSKEMPMQHQEEPPTAILLKPMLAVIRVRQPKRHRRATDQVQHYLDGATPRAPRGRRARIVARPGRRYFLTNLCSAGRTVSATQMSPFGATVM